MDYQSIFRNGWHIGPNYNMKLVTHLPYNSQGTDYIVGDLHGMYDQFTNLLVNIRFDNKVDRVISVGDLCDRGPKSIECLRLLQYDWFHSVMGNHEEMLLAAIYDSDPGVLNFTCDSTDILYNGGQWIMPYIMQSATEWVEELISVNPDIKNSLVILENLPQIIVVGDGVDRYNVVHTNMPLSWDDKKIDSLPEEITSNLFIDNLSLIGDLNRWDRAIDWIPHNVISGLSTTYIGHTIVSKVQYVGPYIVCDTGASLGLKYIEDEVKRDIYVLSMVNTKTGDVYTQTAGFEFNAYKI